MPRFDDDMRDLRSSAPPAFGQRGSRRASAPARSSSRAFSFEASEDPSSYSNVMDFQSAFRARQQETLDQGRRGASASLAPDFSVRKGPSAGSAPSASVARISSGAAVSGSRPSAYEPPKAARAMRNMEDFQVSAFSRSGQYARKGAMTQSASNGYERYAFAGPSSFMGNGKAAGRSSSSASRFDESAGSSFVSSRRDATGGFGGSSQARPSARSGQASAFASRPSSRDRAFSQAAAEYDRREEAQQEEEFSYGRKRSGIDGLKEKMDKRKRESRHRRADREFETHVPQDRNQDASANEGPRAALHKGEMGRSQKRAQKMQLPRFSVPSVGFALPSISIGGLLASSRARVAIGVCACLLVVFAFVYPPAQSYYITLRTNAQMQAQLDAITQRNSEIQERINKLSTDAGVEDKLRAELGWVKKGEVSVSVGREGSSDIASNAEDQTASIAAGSVRAPETWYSGFLDVFFGYDNTPPAPAESKQEGDAPAS